MKKRLNVLLSALLLVLAAVWIVDKIPFTQSIDQKIEAAVYRDGQIIGSTTVSIRGDKTRYLFRTDSFVGEFRIPYVESTDIDGLQTQIRWNDPDNYQDITHFYKGAFTSADKRGLVNILLISEDMDDFALMTTDLDVIATSPELQTLYLSHITYHGDSRVSVTDTTGIPPLS